MDETMSVAPSEEQGNISVETEPEVAEEVTPETPAEEKVETVETTEPKSELYELPDGRKVDAETLSKEWKENFYPDYTRKSQALAAKEQPLETKTNQFADPEYVPSSYEELLKEAELRAVKAIESKQIEQIEQQKQIETAIETQLSEIKKVDPALNENALFLHANKYGFRDLKVAHQNMRDMSDLAKKVQNKTVQDIAKRADPVSVSPGATGARPNPSNFSTAVEYLNAVKASGK